MPMTVEDLWEK